MGNKALLFVCVLTQTFLNAQNSSKYLKTLKQPAGNLYYATPIELKTKDKTILEIDFTLFYHKDSLNNVSVRYSIYSEKPISKLDSLGFLIDKTSILAPDVPKLIYVEQVKGKWHYRYENIITLSQYLELIKQSAQASQIRLSTKEKTWLFIPTKKYKESGAIIYEIMKAEIGF